MKLRWFIQETEKETISSWVSGSPRKYTERSDPILQYSSDGVDWADVPTVIELEKS